MTTSDGQGLGEGDVQPDWIIRESDVRHGELRVYFAKGSQGFGARITSLAMQDCFGIMKDPQALLDASAVRSLCSAADLIRTRCLRDAEGFHLVTLDFCRDYIR